MILAKLSSMQIQCPLIVAMYSIRQYRYKLFHFCFKADDVKTVCAGDGPFTLFAPTESAFQKLDPQTWDSVRNNKTALTGLSETL